MSNDFNTLYRRVNNFIVQAADDGRLNSTFLDFFDNNPGDYSDIQHQLAIIVNSQGQPRIDTDANSRGDVVVGWPYIELSTDLPNDNDPNLDELLEQRARDFRRACKRLIREISEQPEKAIELCQLEFGLEKAWMKLLEIEIA